MRYAIIYQFPKKLYKQREYLEKWNILQIEYFGVWVFFSFFQEDYFFF
jgi:hypothetical protein